MSDCRVNCDDDDDVMVWWSA